jgi:hypothetical protein
VSLKESKGKSGRFINYASANNENNSALQQMCDQLFVNNDSTFLPKAESAICHSDLSKEELLKIYVNALQGFLKDLHPGERKRFNKVMQNYYTNNADKFVEGIKPFEMDGHLRRLLAFFFYVNAIYNSDLTMSQLNSFHFIQKILRERLDS